MKNNTVKFQFDTIETCENKLKEVEKALSKIKEASKIQFPIEDDERRQFPHYSVNYLQETLHNVEYAFDQVKIDLEKYKKKIEYLENNKDKIENNEPVEVNSNGVNIKIKANILSDDEMQKIGFTEYRKGYLHFGRMIQFPKEYSRDIEISFGVTIPRDGSDIRIDVLDDAFCQPYDYQRILRDDPNFKTALIVQEQVEKWMKYLEEAGVIQGHVYGEYI